MIDAITKEKLIFNAKVIFCCASTIASTSILMQSKSKRFPNGLGNDCGELGHNLMDHHFKVGATAEYNGFEGIKYINNRPASFHIPRFQNLGDSDSKKEFLRGYSFQGSASRGNWHSFIGLCFLISSDLIKISSLAELISTPALANSIIKEFTLR